MCVCMRSWPLVPSLHANRRGKSGSSERFSFLGSSITVGGNYSHEIKRYWPFGREAMTNLESVLKITDITLSTKVHTAKAVIFPIIMYRYERQTIKENRALMNWCFWIVVLEKSLQSSLDSRRDWTRGNQPWTFIEELMLKFKYFGLLMGRAKSVKKTLMLKNIEGRRRRGQQRIKWLDSIMT